jgi:calcium binding protein
MEQRQRDPDREDRIDNQIVADAYGAEEQTMAWYYYLEDKLRFPFHARCIFSNAVSPLREGEFVDVHRIAPEEVCSTDMLVMIEWHGRTRDRMVGENQFWSSCTASFTARAIPLTNFSNLDGFCVCMGSPEFEYVTEGTSGIIQDTNAPTTTTRSMAAIATGRRSSGR